MLSYIYLLNLRKSATLALKLAERTMRLLIVLLLLSFVPITTVAEIQVDRFTCKPWSNGGLRMRGDVQLELSGLHLMWTNGKNTQTALMMNPEDKLEGTAVSYTHLTLPTTPYV